MCKNPNANPNLTEGEPRESKLVFIGKSLQHDELRAGFRNCLATDRSEAQLEEARWAARRAALRFQVAAAL